MGFNVSNEFNSTAKQLQGILGQLGSATGNSNLSSLSGSIFSIVGSVEQIKSDDANAKANGIMNLVNQAFNLIEKLGNIQANAQKKVQNDKKKAKEIEKDAKQTETDLNKSMEEIGENINEQGDIVTNATKEMQQAQNDLNDKQEKINEIIKQIQEKQARLEQSEDPYEQKALLDEIFALGASISTLTASTEDIQENIENASQAVTDAFVAIETAKGNAVTVQNEGQKQILRSVEKATDATTSTVKTQADGVKNIATGEALLAGSTATAFIPVGGAVLSTEATQKGTELVTAGTTETTGSISNLKDLAQGIGGIKNNTQLLKTFDNAIGGALTEFNNLIVGWNEFIEPVITSIGTLGTEGTYAIQAQELNATIVSDQETIDNYLQGTNNEPLPTSTLNVQSNASSATTGANQVEQDANKKPEYELETPKFSFGI